MKSKFILLMTLLMIVVSSYASVFDSKKEKAEVTFLVAMTCEKCQQRIESNIPYEKGVTDLHVKLSDKLVTIEYRKDKTDVAKLKKAIQDLGFTATLFNPKPAGSADKKK